MVAFLSAGCGNGSGQKQLEAGLTELRNGRFKAAQELLARAVERNPGNPTAHCNLGIAYWKQGDMSNAVTSLSRAAELAPENPRPLELLGHLLTKDKRWNEAREALDRACLRSPRQPSILTAMAVVEFHAGEPALAHRFLAQAIDVDPDYPPLYNMALLYRDRLSDPVKTAEYFRKYVGVAGSDTHVETAEAFLATPPAPVAPDTPRGTPAQASRPVSQPDQGVEQTKPPPKQKAQAQAPSGPPVEHARQEKRRVSPADSLVAEAKDAMAKEEFDEALVTLKQAISKDSGNPDALWHLAVLYDRHMQYADRAVHTYTGFTQKFPGDPRAATAQKRLAALTPSLAPPAREAAQADFKQGLKCHVAKDWDGAIVHYRRALELDNDYASAAYNLGLAYKARGDLEAARDAFSRALSINNDMTQAGYMLAVMWRLLNDNNKAAEQLARVLEIKPDYAKAHYLLGVVCRDQNRHQAARKHFERYVELAPDEPLAGKTKLWLETIP